MTVLYINTMHCIGTAAKSLNHCRMVHNSNNIIIHVHVYSGTRIIIAASILSSTMPYSYSKPSSSSSESESELEESEHTSDSKGAGVEQTRGSMAENKCSAVEWWSSDFHRSC